MPFTRHGHWVGRISPGPDDTPPRLVDRCGGPEACPPCAREAIDAGHTGLDDVAARDEPLEQAGEKPCLCETCRSEVEG